MASTSYGSSSTNNSFVFDIFINHRGPDSKKTLAKHLYDRLSKHGLRVFLDEDELQAGEYITPQIHSAIRTASVHIAIFSPRYADSNWCLDELLLMFESGSTIIPVFYGVEPADLRWGTHGEKGVYGRSLQMLEKKRTHDSQPRYYPSTIQKWRKALFDAAEIKGFDKKTYNGDEQQLLEKVVEGVLQKVKRPLHVSRYSTGLDEKVAEFEGAMSLDQQSSGETRVIGIVGLGGAGKTTLAKEIFNRRRSEYKRTYFQFDVREKAARESLESLQKLILKGLAQAHVEIDSTDDGIEKLKSYLKSSHAFLILDDVDHLQQVEALLLPVKDALQQHSLIIVTSRNKDVLTSSGIAESSIFKLTGLDKDYSRELFCWHAFNQPYPPTEFEQVARAFVDSCAGLPLSLKVLGSLLRRKDLEYGKALLHDISKTLPEDIMATLKISYDNLDKIEKQIFLDIACFFKGQDKDRAIRFWDGSEWGGWLRLRNLESRCLVEVNDENRLIMHDHLRDLGRHIAETEPPEWTLRLSCPTHDFRLLSDKSLVRGISTVHSQGCQRTQPLFRKLKEFAGSRFTNYVRELQLIDTEGRFEEERFMKRIFSGAMSLIWLKWIHFPYSSLPSWISLKNLRVLMIEESKGVQKLWLHESQAPEQLRELYVHSTQVEVPKSIGKLSHLEKIVVSVSDHLTLPDELWHLQSLKHLELEGGLSHIGLLPHRCSACIMNILPDSLGNLTNLQTIKLSLFSSLKVLPGSFGNLTNLQAIDLSLCSSLEVLPDSFGNLTNLQTIRLSRCSSLQVLPDSFGNLTNLQTIHLYGCSSLQGLPGSFGNLTNLGTIDLYLCSSLQGLPDSFGNLTNLRTIDLSLCSSLQVLPDSFGNLTDLGTINLSQCSSLQVLPDSFGNLTNLGTIELSGCSSLPVLPDSFGNLTNLGTINLSMCSSLQVLPNLFGNLTNLGTIELSLCYSLQALPDSFGNLTNLGTIKLFECSSLQVLPDSFGNLTNLGTIQLSLCSSLHVLPDSFGNLTNLRTIELFGCSSLQVLPDSFGNLTNLGTIDLSRCKSLQVLPDSFGNLTNLRTIDLSECSSLQVLPDSFGNLTNLQTIQMYSCESLWMLPDSFGNLTNLRTIDLSGCSMLVLPDSFGNLIQLEGLQFDRLTVSDEVYEKMHTFKCSGVIDFNRVEVLPAGFLTLKL
eukprot:PITA_07627